MPWLSPAQLPLGSVLTSYSLGRLFQEVQELQLVLSSHVSPTPLTRLFVLVVLDLMIVLVLAGNCSAFAYVVFLFI